MCEEPKAAASDEFVERAIACAVFTADVSAATPIVCDDPTAAVSVESAIVCEEPTAAAPVEGPSYVGRSRRSCLLTHPSFM